MSNDERIICPRCGRDLGPIQPLPHSLTKCIKCKIWVNNEGQRAPMELAGPSRDKKPCEACDPQRKVRHD